MKNLDVVFVLGLPRSGTSLVYNLIHTECNRLAPTFKDVGIQVTKDTEVLKKYNKYFKDEDSLAEIHDFSIPTTEVRKWMESKGGKWVLKSVELDKIYEYMEVFPEAKFVVCLRPSGNVLSSVQEYFQATGLKWYYSPTEAAASLASLTKRYPSKFDCIDVEDLPSWESDRTPILSLTSLEIQSHYNTIRKHSLGYVLNPTNDDLKARYS